MVCVAALMLIGGLGSETHGVNDVKTVVAEYWCESPWLLECRKEVMAVCLASSTLIYQFSNGYSLCQLGYV